MPVVLKYDQNFHFLQLSLYVLVIPTQIQNISPQFSNFLVIAATDEELKLIDVQVADEVEILRRTLEA